MPSGRNNNKLFQLIKKKVYANKYFLYLHIHWTARPLTFIPFSFLVTRYSPPLPLFVVYDNRLCSFLQAACGRKIENNNATHNNTQVRGRWSSLRLQKYASIWGYISYRHHHRPGFVVCSTRKIYFPFVTVDTVLSRRAASRKNTRNFLDILFRPPTAARSLLLKLPFPPRRRLPMLCVAWLCVTSKTVVVSSHSLPDYLQQYFPHHKHS